MPRTVDKLPSKPKPKYKGFRSLRFVMHELVDGELEYYSQSDSLDDLQYQRRKVKGTVKTMPISHEWVKTTPTT